MTKEKWDLLVDLITLGEWALEQMVLEADAEGKAVFSAETLDKARRMLKSGRPLALLPRQCEVEAQCVLEGRFEPDHTFVNVARTLRRRAIHQHWEVFEPRLSLNCSFEVCGFDCLLAEACPPLSRGVPLPAIHWGMLFAWRRYSGKEK